jgi:hypothetical protein
MSLASHDACVTLPSGICAVVARRSEMDLELEEEPTAVMPTTLLLVLLAETARDVVRERVPSIEIVEIDPDDIVVELDDVIVDDEMFDDETAPHHDEFEQAFAALTRG